MRSVLTILVALFAVSGAAIAQQPIWAEPQTADAELIAGCLTSHAPNDDVDERADPKRCIGLVSHACAQQAGDGRDTTSALIICANRETRVWRALLDTYAADLRETESEAQRRLLEQALTQGDAWAQARCAYDASLYEGGSLERVIAAFCVRDTMGQRAIDLHLRLAALRER